MGALDAFAGEVWAQRRAGRGPRAVISSNDGVGDNVGSGRSQLVGSPTGGRATTKTPRGLQDGRLSMSRVLLEVWPDNHAARRVADMGDAQRTAR